MHIKISPLSYLDDFSVLAAGKVATVEHSGKLFMSHEISDKHESKENLVSIIINKKIYTYNSGKKIL